MVSKDWKALAVAVASTVLLTACGNDDKKNNTDNKVNYAGIWIESETFAAFKPYVNKPMTAESIRGFCEEDVANNPVHHGLSARWGRQIRPNIWLIQASGDVLYYSPYRNREVHEVSYRSRNLVGKVNDYGVYTKSLNANFNNYNGYYDFQILPMFAVQNLTISREAETLVLRPQSDAYDAVETLVRISERDAELYGRALRICRDQVIAARSSEWGMGCDMRHQMIYRECAVRGPRPMPPVPPNVGTQAGPTDPRFQPDVYQPRYKGEDQPSQLDK